MSSVSEWSKNLQFMNISLFNENLTFTIFIDRYLMKIKKIKDPPELKKMDISVAPPSK